MPLTRKVVAPTTGAKDSTNRLITRCAVCKVDLKGRFVYVDQPAQHLLGYPSEDLFGKQIVDFVDEHSRAIINEILTRRNGYETTFDHFILAVNQQDGSIIQLDTVVTLNFNAGNPVNFQFIFNPDEAVSVDTAYDPDAGMYRRFAEYICERDITTDWREFLQNLREFAGALQACVYIVTPDHIEHRSSALESADSPVSLVTVTEPGPIHRFVADSGEFYDFTDDTSVRRAIELHGGAPNEVVGRIALDEDRVFLIRVIFADSLEDQSARSRADRAHFALELVRRLAARPAKSGAERDEENTQFTVGLLDGLSIGAIMTDSRGRVTLYNPAIADLLCLEEVGGDLNDFAQLLGADDAEAERIRTYLAPDGPRSPQPHELFPVTLPSGRRALLTYLPLSQDPVDHSLFLTLIPGLSEAAAGDVLNFCRIAFHWLVAQAESAAQQADKFGRRFAAKIGEEGGIQLTRLNTCLQGLARVMHHNADVTTVSAQVQAPEMTDLNIVVHRITNQLNRTYSGLLLRVHSEIMPKINARRRSIALAVELLLAGIAEAVDRSTATVQISAALSSPVACVLTVGVHGTLKLDTPAYAVGMAATQLLIRDIGGTIVENRQDSETTIELTLPIEA